MIFLDPAKIVDTILMFPGIKFRNIFLGFREISISESNVQYCSLNSKSYKIQLCDIISPEIAICDIFGYNI